MMVRLKKGVLGRKVLDFSTIDKLKAPAGRAGFQPPKRYWAQGCPAPRFPIRFSSIWWVLLWEWTMWSIWKVLQARAGKWQKRELTPVLEFLTFVCLNDEFCEPSAGLLNIINLYEHIHLQQFDRAKIQA